MATGSLAAVVLLAAALPTPTATFPGLAPAAIEVAPDTGARSGVGSNASFQAAVARATQLSFEEAPDRYPFIMESILNATKAAAAAALP